MSTSKMVEVALEGEEIKSLEKPSVASREDFNVKSGRSSIASPETEKSFLNGNSFNGDDVIVVSLLAIDTQTSAPTSQSTLSGSCRPQVSKSPSSQVTSSSCSGSIRYSDDRVTLIFLMYPFIVVAAFRLGYLSRRGI